MTHPVAREVVNQANRAHPSKPNRSVRRTTPIAATKEDRGDLAFPNSLGEGMGSHRFLNPRIKRVSRIFYATIFPRCRR
jgi:hypothetical protein